MQTRSTRPLMEALDARPTFTSELDPGALIDADLFAAFTSGELPVAREVHVARLADGNSTTLDGGRVVRTVRWSHTRWTLVEGDGWRVRFRADRDGEAFAWVFGVDEEVVDRVAATIAGWKAPAPDLADAVEVTFAYLGRHCPNRTRRRIDASAWDDVRGNYAAPVRGALERLVAIEPDGLDGRLLLLWGPPGTGKTTLLRTLARHWRPWCDALYVTDPERLLADPAYLSALVLEHDDDAPGPAGRRWTLLVLEDCDELVRPDAKHASGQALSRLLNLTDGMVGQGLRVLVCLTTNEELWRLHPAVTRPGRCLAQVEVGRLDRAEARAWLATHAPHVAPDGHVGPDGATLAELFALAHGRVAIDVRAEVATAGLYL